MLESLRVTRIGTATLERLSRDAGKPGRVHSVFERAINVLWCDGHLLTLHGSGPLAAPFAVALDRLPPRAAMAPGMAIERRAFDWLDAERVGLEMPEGPLGFGVDALPDSPVAPALRSATGEHARQALARALATRDTKAFVDAAAALVGFGEGLTPAGDDCVVGALAAIHRLAPGRLASPAGERDRLAEAGRRRTTDIARDFLLEALDGRFAEPVLALMSAPSDEVARVAARRFISTGATSGADTLCGIRLGCRALETSTARP